MSDHNRTNGMNLADALRALPLATPERSAWRELAARLSRKTGDARRETRSAEHIRRFVIPAALAAALAAVFVVTYQQREPRAADPVATTATVAPAGASSS